MDAAAYTPPPGCTLRHVELWRRVVEAARQLARKPSSTVTGLRTLLKDCGKSPLPYTERHLASPFYRLLRGLAGYPAVPADLKPARALELGALAEAVAQGLGDDFDAAVCARVLNPTRPRADLDN
jgi:hypothetical protein